jgi:hypothetical protein
LTAERSGTSAADIKSASRDGLPAFTGKAKEEQAMPDLNPLEEKLAEVIGLAQAAEQATEKVGGMLDDDKDLAQLLQKMNEESKETTERATKVAEEREGKKTAILEMAAETKKEGVKMMGDYLDADSDELDGFEFLIMTEAGEAGHWAILGKLNEKAGESAIGELVDWALPVQEGHLSAVRDGSLDLAAAEDPESD